MQDFWSLKEKIINLITPILEKNHLKIYEVNNVQDFGDDVLQILIEDETDWKKSLDFDLLTKINEAISKLLDEHDDWFIDSYVLEVASSGIERAIKTIEELKDAIGEYVHLEFSDSKTNEKIKTNATLEGYEEENDLFVFSYFIKGQRKTKKMKFADIAFIRYAIKF